MRAGSVDAPRARSVLMRQLITAPKRFPRPAGTHRATASPPLPSCAGETSTALATVVRNHARTVRLWAQEVEDAQDRLCVRCMPGDLGYAPRCFALRRTHSARTSAQQIILSCGLGRMRSHIPDPRTSSLITVPTPIRGKVTHDVWCACATQLCEV